ncbi:hypothetical protein QTP81_05155 [Alteromonas sp. ASW11-36]|uniref:Uncharacterized protein n=1 Tax=Alteromonas arenosi TaxID=3055817 RepID=A0ABT7SUX2_9ALTE|nr:hypothetical protein [Alteromonas sp. ASW11-36]MDM7859981.1 hypothetical protein [Alteromonas sp. ASW11-36]
MTTRPVMALPAQLKKALEQHRIQADVADDEELESLISKLDVLNDKVSFYKAKLRKKNA